MIITGYVLLQEHTLCIPTVQLEFKLDPPWYYIDGLHYFCRFKRFPLERSRAGISVANTQPPLGALHTTLPQHGHWTQAYLKSGRNLDLPSILDNININWIYGGFNQMLINAFLVLSQGLWLCIIDNSLEPQTINNYLSSLLSNWKTKLQISLSF